MSDDSRPLDAMLRELPAVPDDVPREPVHTRVLEVGPPERPAYLISVYADPGSALALHRALRMRVEGTLLGELCRTPAELREAETPAPVALVLVAYALPNEPVEPALAAFALERVESTDPRVREAVARSRGEAYALDIPIPDEPVAVFTATIARDADEKRVALERALVDELGDSHWGEKPGAYAAQLARLSAVLGLGRIDATLDGLDAAEALFASREPGRVRAISPMIFQSLCELVGVVATKALGLTVDFADCATDDEGFTPPPLLRAHTRAGHVHVPVGLDLLRWLVMPLAPGEAPASLRAWLLDRLGGT